MRHDVGNTYAREALGAAASHTEFRISRTPPATSAFDRLGGSTGRGCLASRVARRSGLSRQEQSPVLLL